MPGKMQTLINPMTLALQQAIEHAKSLRDRADNFDALSTSAAPVQSWSQALARVLQGYVAGRERKTADSTETDAQTKIAAAMMQAHKAFQADVASGMTPEQLHAKYSGNPTMADDLKPYDDIWLAGAKKGAEESNSLVDTPDKGYQPKSTQIGRVPTDMNKTVVTLDGGKTYIVNGVKVTADRLAQANGPPIAAQTSMSMDPLAPQPIAETPAPAPTGGGLPFTPPNIGQVESGNHDFLPNGQPVTSHAGAQYGMQVMPSTAADPGYGVPPVPKNILDLPATDPRRAAAFDHTGALYAQAMQARFGANGPGAYNAGPGRMASHLMTGAPLPAETQAYGQKFAGGSKQPDGVINGKPYWLINGTPYDNPNGN